MTRGALLEPVARLDVTRHRAVAAARAHLTDRARQLAARHERIVDAARERARDACSKGDENPHSSSIVLAIWRPSPHDTYPHRDASSSAVR
jgi:hypothetical protein